MRPRRPLPPELIGPAFSPAEAERLGVTPRRLRDPQVISPFPGVRAVESGEARDPRLDYIPRLGRGQRFSHTSAAAFYGAPMPKRNLALHVASNTAGRPRIEGVVGHRDPHRARLVDGLPLSEPARTFLECASVLRLEELVAVGDHLVLTPRRRRHGDRPWIGLESLRRWIWAPDRDGARGIRRARQAVDLVRDGAESGPETSLRLLMTGAGLPEPVLQFELVSKAGVTIGWFDMAYVSRRVLVEYDGDQHRTTDEQYEKDIRRFDDAAAEGWTVVRVRKAGLRRAHRSDTIRRVRRALAGRVGDLGRQTAE